MIIALTGEMGTGKSTALDLIKELVPANVLVKNIKFAQTLYDMQDELYDIIWPVYERPENFIKDRKLLQFLGTEWGRALDPDLWVKLWKKDIEAARTLYIKGITSLITCDDLRFDNEAKTIKEMGGIIIKMTSNKTSDRINTQGSNHASEAGIDMSYVDYIIENNGSIEDLRESLLTLNSLKHIW